MNNPVKEVLNSTRQSERGYEVTFVYSDQPGEWNLGFRNGEALHRLQVSTDTPPPVGAVNSFT